MDPHDTTGARRYLREAKKRKLLDMTEPQELETPLETNKIEDKATLDSASRLLLLENKSLVVQVAFIMKDRTIPMWSKIALTRIVRQSHKLSRYERRMKEREAEGRFRFKGWILDWDFTTSDVIRVLNALGKIYIGIITGSALIFTAEEFIGNFIRSGGLTRIVERVFGL